MKNLFQPVFTCLLLILCMVLSLSLFKMQQGEAMPLVKSYSWQDHPDAIAILQRSASTCGCAPKIADMALTGVSHGHDVLVLANKEAGEVESLKKEQLSKKITVVSSLPKFLEKRFFQPGQSLVMVRVRNGKIVHIARNGIPPESFFQ